MERKHLTTWMQEKGIGVRELGQKLGYTGSTAVVVWRSGKSVPKVDTAERVAQVLGVEPGAILWGEPGSVPESPVSTPDTHLERELGLSEHGMTLLRLLAEGKTHREVGETVGLSDRQVASRVRWLRRHDMIPEPQQRKYQSVGESRRSDRWWALRDGPWPAWIEDLRVRGGWTEDQRSSAYTTLAQWARKGWVIRLRQGLYDINDAEAGTRPIPPRRSGLRKASSSTRAGDEAWFAEKKERLEDIAARRIAGETLQEIGEELGLTKERVRQLQKVALRYGLLTTEAAVDWARLQSEFDTGASHEELAQSHKLPLGIVQRHILLKPESREPLQEKLQKYPWPMTAVRAAEVMQGRSDLQTLKQTTSKLGRWVMCGYLERIAPGLYDLPRQGKRPPPPQLVVDGKKRSQMLHMLIEGVDRFEIARRLDITPHTLKNAADNLSDEEQAAVRAAALERGRLNHRAKMARAARPQIPSGFPELTSEQVAQLTEAYHQNVSYADMGKLVDWPAHKIQKWASRLVKSGVLPSRENSRVAKSHWAEARQLNWPMNVKEYAACLKAEPTERDIRRAAVRLSRWVGYGRMVRLPSGKYDLSQQQEPKHENP